MKKFLFGTLAIVVLTVVVALIAPSFIDWNAYRAEIATEVHKATGRKMVIDGPIDVALLPTPKLSVGKVRLANLDGAATPDMVRLDALDVRVAFWPLLSGKIVVDSVVLKGADIELEALADGRVNWDLKPEHRSGVATAKGGAPSTSAGDSSAIRLNQVVIDNGRVTWRDSRKGTVERVENINARLAAETLAGPYVLRGRATAHAIPLTVSARIGRTDTGRPVPLSAELGLQNVKTTAKVSGTFTLGDTPGANIRIDASGDNLGRTIAALTGGGTSPAMLGHKFSLQADMTGDTKSFTVNDMSMTLNGTRVTGGVSARLGPVPSIDVALGVSTLDLDSWLQAAEKPVKAQAPRTSGSDPSKGSHNGAGAAAKNGAAPAKPFSFPKNMRISVDARIGGVTYNKGAIQDIELQAALENGAVKVSRISAQLPGGADAEVSGRVVARANGPRFDGRVETNIADARQFMDWLGIDHAAIAPDRLRRISFKSGLAISGDRVDLSDLDLHFDTTHIGGGVVVALRDRPGIGATILIDQLNLDHYLVPPAGSSAKGPGSGGAGAPGPAAAETSGRGVGLAALGAFDANLRVQARQLIYKGVTLDGVALDSALIGGNLTVKTLKVANLAGGSLDASGTVKEIDKSPTPDIRFSLQTKRPDRLFALAGISSPIPAAKLSPFRLDGTLKSDAKATQVKANLGAGQLKVAVNGALTGLGAMPSVTLNLKADHPSFIDFVRLFDPGFTPRAQPKGPFSLSARAENDGLDIKLENVKAKLGQANVTGSARVSLLGARPKLTADFKAGTIVADQFVPKSLGSQDGNARGSDKSGVPGPSAGGVSSGAPWSDAPFELDAMRKFDADVKVEAKSLLWRSWTVTGPHIDMTLDDGRFDLRRVSGSTVGGTFQLSGALVAPAKVGGPAELKADVDITRADLRKAMFNLSAVDIASGKVTFRTSFQGKGASSRALVSSLQGSGNLDATDGAVTGFDLGAVNEKLKHLNEPASFLGLLQTAMSGGTTKFSSLKGTFKIEKGVVRSDDITLKADGGSGAATLSADLPKWRIDSNATFRLSGHKDAPPFRMQIKGPLDSPSRIFNVNELQSWLVSRGVGGLMQKFLQKKAPAQTTPSPPTPSQDSGQKKQTNPDQFIRGIFDLLNQGKKK